MRILRWIFGILVVCGCWRPSSWSSPFQKFLYNLYTCAIFSTVYYVTISQFVDIVLHARNQEEFTDTIYILLALIISCHKMYNLLMGRRRIAILCDTLEKEPFLPRDDEEMEIRSRFDSRSRLITICYTFMVETTACCLTLAPVLTNVQNKRLPYKIWLPSNYSSALYGFFYVQEVIALTIGGLLHVACDSLICGLLIHVCSQIDILGCRFRAIKPGENESVKPLVRYHYRVFRFASMINEEYRMVIFVQFAVSMLLVCINLYLLTTMESFNVKLMGLVGYMWCMLVQIFFYCWYGNELKLKSLEISGMIFEIDWTSLRNNTKKLLLMIMRRAMEPIEITSVYVVTMNLDSFVVLLKMSYSAYNVLQQGRKQ